MQRRVETDLRGLLDTVINADFPLLGACYGIGTLGSHQGAVADRRYAEPVGSVPVTLTRQGRQDPLLRAVPTTFDAFTGHKEAISRLPHHAVLLASSPTCPVQAFRIGSAVYATQFHPELDAAGLCTRIEVYKHAGYFEPGQASELKALVHRSNVTHPPAIVRRFVQRYAHSAPSGAQAKPRPAGRRFPGRPVAVSSTYALRAGLRMAITSACKRSPQASAAIAHYGVRLAGLLPLGWCSTVVSEEGKNTLSWPSRQRTR